MRTGNDLSGSLDGAITKRSAGSGVSKNDQLFSGVIEGNGLSLQAQTAKGSQASSIEKASSHSTLPVTKVV
jgi:hypothetical protein